MLNWEAVHECEDERDAERLRKQAQQMNNKTSGHNDLSIQDEDDILELLNGQTGEQQIRQSREEFRMRQLVLLLQQAGWLNHKDVSANVQDRITSEELVPFHSKQGLLLPKITAGLVTKWKKEVVLQERSIATARQNALNPDHQIDLQPTGTSIRETCIPHKCKFALGPCPSTDSSKLQDNPTADSHLGILTPCEVITKIGNERDLNAKQWLAFRIITQHFVDKYIDKRDTDRLAMLMTGPGGTGKTYVVNAVRSVMEHYGCGHMMRYLAPTGSAATLIGGMTIHKGLGIKIKQNNKGKGNRTPGESKEDYSILVTVSQRSKLREEWKNVGFVLLDEVSLTDLELLAEIDNALRIAKERLDLWFGGIVVIFSGDFFQYPPIGGKPLYTPISRNAKQTETEMRRRLGRLAWKSINTVVNLSEQQRMKGDPVYAEAVQRLRVRECTFDDVNLFNSRVVKCAERPFGVHVDDTNGQHSAAIVSTNKTREELNRRKTYCEVPGSTEVVPCAAFDKCSQRSLTLDEREFIVDLDVTTIKQSLPGKIFLYEGMPCILRSRNISTDLGITNGSQGIVRKICTEYCAVGLKYTSCALVEFPGSKVELSDLPKTWFPISPVTWSFMVSLKAESCAEGDKVRVVRSQLPIQPAFAVTGHSAQGKTLPKVLADISDGGFPAYVAASRATSREGICLMHPVTLDKLNKPLPSDLLFETRRFEALEHNTYIRYSVREGDLVSIPDAEGVLSGKVSVPKLIIAGKAQGKDSRSNRKREISLDLDDNSGVEACKPPSAISLDRIAKKQKTADVLSTESPLLTAAPVMTLLYTYRGREEEYRQSWKVDSNHPYVLTDAYDTLQQSDSNMYSRKLFDILRDRFRDYLHAQSPTVFPRFGCVGTSLVAILELLFPETSRQLQITLRTQDSENSPVGTHSSSLELSNFFTVPSICMPFQWPLESGSSTMESSIQEWFDNWVRNCQNTVTADYMAVDSLSTHTLFDFRLTSIPPVLFFELVPLNLLKPHANLYIPNSGTTVQYSLIWKYDGRCNEGTPELEPGAYGRDLCNMLHFGDREAHVLIYASFGT